MRLGSLHRSTHFNVSITVPPGLSYCMSRSYFARRLAHSSANYQDIHSLGWMSALLLKSTIAPSVLNPTTSPSPAASVSNSRDSTSSSAFITRILTLLQASCQRLLFAHLSNLPDFHFGQDDGSGLNCVMEFAERNSGCLDGRPVGQVRATLRDMGMRRRGEGGEILCKEDVVSLWF
jgi:hypothetical protein